jgi:hypothetical protein
MLSSSAALWVGRGAETISIDPKVMGGLGSPANTTVTCSPLLSCPPLELLDQAGHRGVAVTPPAIGAGADPVHSADQPRTS